MLLFDLLRRGLLCLLAVAGSCPLVYALAPVSPSNCVAVALSATATNAAIDITWNDNSTNETQWKIQYSANNGAYLDYTVTSGTTGATGPTGISLSGFALNTAYRFKILAFNGTEYSTVSNVATVGTYDLNGPINLSVTAVDPFNVMMSWEEGSTGEAGFAIETKTGAGPWEYLGYVAANVLSVDPINLISPLGSFSFRVRAYKGSPPITPDSPAGENVSGYSNIATVTASSYPLTATAVPAQSIINLSWPNILNESGYQILYKPDNAPSFSELALVAANVITYQVTAPAIEPATTYSFMVRPYVNSEVIGESGTASVTIDGITSKSGSSGTPGSAFAHAFTHVSSSTVSSRTVSGTPSTLTFNSSTGDLSGVYPALGTYTLNYTVNFTNGSHLSQTFFIRVRPPAGPPLVGTLIPAWSGLAGASHDTPLAGTFSDPEAESAVRVGTSLGAMDFILFDTATPATVTNFMSYVSSGKFADVAFHRSITGFVIQGGGFKGAGTGSAFTSVVTAPPVINEPGIANVRGTVSMAKVGGNPNSATSQFFVSLGDNRANLDYQNGGFTVFGRVAGDGMAVADAISALPTATYNLFLDGSATATAFGDFPMNAASPPDPMDQTQLVKINSVGPIPTLSYSITGNSHPEVATASIVGGQLHLSGLSGGQTTITVTATDLDNLTTSQTVAVTISDYLTWAEAFTNPPLADSAAAADPDHDGLDNLLEYVLGSDPRLPNQGGPALGSDGGNLKFTFKRKDSSETSDVALAVEVSTDLSHWNAAYTIGASTASSSPGVDVLENGADDDLITVTIPKGTDARKFVRVRAATTHDPALDTYATWAARTVFPGGQSGAGQNPDGDSLTNLQEYAWFGDPAVASNAPLPVPGRTGVAPAPQFQTLTFPVRKHTSGLSYVVESSNSLTDPWTQVWSSANGFAHAQVVSAADQADRTVVTIKDSVALGTQQHRFMRVRVAQD